MQEPRCRHASAPPILARTTCRRTSRCQTRTSCSASPTRAARWRRARWLSSTAASSSPLWRTARASSPSMSSSTSLRPAPPPPPPPPPSPPSPPPPSRPLPSPPPPSRRLLPAHDFPRLHGPLFLHPALRRLRHRLLAPHHPLRPTGRARGRRPQTALPLPEPPQATESDAGGGDVKARQRRHPLHQGRTRHGRQVGRKRL